MINDVVDGVIAVKEGKGAFMRKRRWFAMLMALCMILGSLMLSKDAARADYEDGDYCWYCGKYRWDGYRCGMCGACSEEATDNDCHEMTHCSLCGECLQSVEFCDNSHNCVECLKEEGFHCMDCGECFCHEPEALCGVCFRCDSCAGEICEDCGFCEECAAEEGDVFHCVECGACATVTDFCEEGDGNGEHCVECHVICEECGRCNLVEDLEICSSCGLCEDCCISHAEDLGCDCGNYCVEGPGWDEHICGECGACFDEIEQCPYCELCLDCCESESECSAGMCIEDPDYAEHFCEDCGVCFCDTVQCETCEANGVSRCRECCEELCEAEGCTCGDQCISDPDFDEHLAVKHKGITPAKHTSAVPRARYTYNTTQHWKDCMYCDSAGHITGKENHTFDSKGCCTVCGYVKGIPLAITQQPVSAVGVVNPWNASYGKDSHKVKFRLEAVGKGKLHYKWVFRKVGEKYWMPVDSDGCKFRITKSCDSNMMVIAVPNDACYETYEIKCFVADETVKNMDSTLEWIESDTVTLTAKHTYHWFDYYTSDENSFKLKDSGKIITWKGSEGHIRCCDGCGMEYGKIRKHTFDPGEYAGEDTKGREWLKHSCRVCGYTEYFQKHDHTYDNFTIDEEHTTDFEHALICDIPDCGHITHELHHFEPYIVATPYESEHGAFRLDCTDCGFSKNDPNPENFWTKSNYLGYVAKAGILSKTTFTKEDTLTIRVNLLRYWARTSKRDFADKKITGWKAECRKRTGEYTEDKKDVTSYFTFTKLADGDWTAVMKTDPGMQGGCITFDPVFADCTHGSTKVVNKKATVCCIAGYTGDTVCADCGKLVKTGNPIPPLKKSHDGPLTFIAGTQIKGSCEERGFEGYYRCGTCGEKVRGKSTGFDHSKYAKVTEDEKEATCTEDGYTGDQFCSHCGKLIQRGRIVPSCHMDTEVVNYKKPTKEEAGYSGDTYCNTCKQIVAYGHILPKEYVRKIQDEFIKLPIPKIGDTAALKPNTIAVAQSANLVSGAWKVKSASGSWSNMGSTDTFMKDKQYLATLNLYWGSTAEVTDKTKIHVNGKYCPKSTINIGKQQCWHVEYEFTATEEGGLPPVIGSFVITFDPPTVGESATDTPRLSTTTEGLKLYDAHWLDTKGIMTSGTFEKGSRYWVEFYAAPEDGYQFPEGKTSVSGTFNGLSCSLFRSGSQWKCKGEFFVKNKIDISGGTVSGVKNLTYTGEPLEQKGATLTVDGKVLSNDGTDYEIRYENNILVGKATMTFVGRGNYTGEKQVTFKINYRIGWNEDAEGWCYKRKDGTWATLCWEKLGGKYYYFDANGYMMTGWQKVGGKWYYLDPATGAMKTGWLKTGGKWYYLDPASGAMQTGWVNVSGKYYYMNPKSGIMMTGWVKTGGKWYYLDPESGEMKTGWLEYKGEWYFLSSPGGHMVTKWKKIGGKWYYFGTDGIMVHDTTMVIDGKSYTFDSQGVCQNP